MHIILFLSTNICKWCIECLYFLNREVKDSRYLTEKVTTKAAKEMFEHASKIESEYKQLINAVIPGSNLAYMCTQIKSCVEEEQSKALWVPSGYNL